MACPGGGRTDSFQASVAADDFGGSAPYTAKGQYAPQTLQDLVACVIKAEATGKSLKACGSRYSFSHAYWSDDILVDTSALNRHLSQPTGGALPRARRDTQTAKEIQRFRSPEHDFAWLSLTMQTSVRDAGALLVHVEAGIKIKDLLADLALAVGSGLAVPTMGAGGAQSLAGAISTGTHGSDIRLQTLGDAVRAVHLVGPGGQEWWIERKHGFSDATKLPDIPGWCADTRIVQDDYFFYATLVSMGRMGVIYAFVLELRPEYWLEEHRGKHPWATIRNQLIESIAAGYWSEKGVFKHDFAGQPLHFYQVVLNPNDRESCWVTERWLTDERLVIGEKADDFDPIATFCKPAQFTPAVVTLILALSTVLALNPLTAAAAATLAGVVVGGSETFGDLISKLLAIAPDSTIGSFNGFILDSEHEPTVRRNISYAILDQGKYARAGCMHGDSAEYFFNAQHDGFLQFVDDVFAHAEAAGAIPGYVSLRFTRQSDALMAMERFPIVVAIEVTSLRPWAPNENYYRKVEGSALANGGIPHWGQGQAIARDVVERIYGPALSVFRWVIAEIESAGTPGTFSSEFTRFKGLESLMSLEDHRAMTQNAVVRLSEVFGQAMQDLNMRARPSSVRELAALFCPGLRDNATGELLPWGRAQHGGTRVDTSVRLLRLRFR